MAQTTFSDLSHLSTLDDFLDEEGIREEVTLRAVQSVIALQLQKTVMSGTSRRSGRQRASRPG